MDTLSKHFVSVIIPVYNDSKRLSIVVKSLIKQSYPKSRYEVIVVDNGSIDDSLIVAQGFKEKYPELIKTITENSIQSSYAARNKGLNAAKGDIVAFTDSDCIAHRDWILEGVNTLENNNCEIAGGKIELFFQISGSPNIWEIFDKHHFFRQRHNIEEAFFSVTANLFTYKSTFEDIGTFNSDLKSGGDREWGSRAAASNYNFVFTDKAIIYHPARHLLKQHLRKGRRVSLGLYDLYYRQHTRIDQIKMLLVRDTLPPIRRLISILTNEQIKGRKKRFELALLVLLFKYLNLYWNTGSTLRWRESRMVHQQKSH
nr:glycosyltransferase [uncultured Desulfobacter sp.]